MSDDMAQRFQSLHEIVKAARQNLDRNIWDYMRGATETETTAKRNRMALDSLAFRPRVLRDVSTTVCTSELFGKSVELPAILAPIGSLESFDDRGGVAAMEAAGKAGVGLMLSSVSTVQLESVAEAADGLKIAMLYKRGDTDWMNEYVDRSIDAGYDAFCLTVDSAHYSRRERDIANRFVKPWRTGKGSYYQSALSWDDIKGFKERYDIPLILKGIATAEDAVMAVEHGIDMVYVSNHGGRQLDHGRGALDVLPEVVQAVAGRSLVAVDGGINRGSDVVKALALGADAVGIGRLFCCALAAGGTDGVVRMLDLLKEEVHICLALLGVTSLQQLSTRHLHAVQPIDPPHVFSSFPLLAPDDYTY